MSQVILKRKNLEITNVFETDTVYDIVKLRHTETGKRFIGKRNMRKNIFRDEWIAEMELYKTMDHPNILPFVENFGDARHVWCLSQHTKTHTDLLADCDFPFFGEDRERAVSRIIGQIVLALKYLHEKREIAYMNLCNESVVVCETSTPKLYDFSLAEKVKQSEPFYYEDLGRYDYESPEIIKYKPFLFSHDIWCVGVLTFELMFNETPFFDEKASVCRQKILECTINFPEDASEDLQDFIKAILKRSRTERLSLDQMLTHPWIRKFKRKRKKRKGKKKKKKKTLSTGNPKDQDVNYQQT